MTHKLLFALPVVLVGCAMHAQPIAELPLRMPARIAPALHTHKTVLVLPFEDDRGDRFAKISPTVFIPVVHLFHAGGDTYYPEQGVLRTHARFGHEMLVGSAADAMSPLLVRAMRTMGLDDAVFSSDAKSAGQHDFDYVVVGHLERTHFRADRSGLVGELIGMVGVPTGAARYDLEYEVQLLDGHDRKTVLMSRGYRFADKRVTGVWYNRDWAYDLFVDGLEATLPSVVGDLATALACAPQSPMAGTPTASRYNDSR